MKTLLYFLLDKIYANRVDTTIEVAYELGSLTKDSKVNTNLCKSITYEQSILMIINASIVTTKGKGKQYADKEYKRKTKNIQNCYWSFFIFAQ